MSDYRLSKASGLIEWYIRFFNMAALTTPWMVVYVLEEHCSDDGLIMHELIHIEQMKREGPWLVLLKYHYYTLRYGYWRNPYEVEARLLSGYPSQERGLER